MARVRIVAICCVLALLTVLYAAVPAEACYACSEAGFCEAVEAGRRNCIDGPTGCRTWGPAMQCGFANAAMSSVESGDAPPTFAAQTSAEPAAIENGACQPIEVGLVMVPEPLAP